MNTNQLKLGQYVKVYHRGLGSYYTAEVDEIAGNRVRITPLFGIRTKRPRWVNDYNVEPAMNSAERCQHTRWSAQCTTSRMTCMDCAFTRPMTAAESDALPSSLDELPQNEIRPTQVYLEPACTADPIDGPAWAEEDIFEECGQPDCPHCTRPSVKYVPHASHRNPNSRKAEGGDAY